MKELLINGERLWQSLMQHAEIGATIDGGVCRETLTEADKEGRDLFAHWCREEGMDIGIDELGNMFATRAGEDDDLPPVAVGSHLDTQPTGGKFDGILGVLAGLEMVRTLNERGISTRRPLTIVNWSNEEGSRFHPSMAASGVFSGVFPLSDASGWVDRKGIYFFDALESIGYRGVQAVGQRQFHAFLELHIEQGPVLEQSKAEIGVVTGVQAMSFNTVRICGEERHAGTTPMSVRLDPIAAFLRIASACYALGNQMPDARVTIGYVDAKPGSHSTIPREIEFTLDLRHPDETALGKLTDLFEQAVTPEQERGFMVERHEFGASSALKFDEGCIAAVRQAAQEAGFSHRDMLTGAGHDAVYVAKVCPTGMIFVPCREGISHNPKESITPEEAAAGAEVLCRAAMSLAS